MSPTEPRRLGRYRDRTRRYGIIAAIALAVALAAVFVTVALLSEPAPETGDELADGENIEVLTLSADAGEQGEDMLIQLADEDDPSKLDGEITAERFEPVDERTRRVDAPAAWLFLEDQRTVRITANTGTLVIPPGQRRPRSGVLEGDVLVRLYDPGAPTDPGGRPDLDRAEPALTATFDRPVSFDLELARLSTPGRVDVTTDAITFAASDLFAVLNEARERIEFLEFKRGHRLVLEPSAGRRDADTRRDDPATDDPRRPAPQAAPRTAPGTAGVGPGSEPDPAARDAPKIDRYRIVALDDVALDRGPLGLEADAMTAWIRLIDNRLVLDRDASADAPAPSPSAPAPPAARTNAGPEADRGVGANAGADGAASIGPTGTPRASAAEQDRIVFEWTGPLTVEPLDADTARLAEDDLAARFTARKRKTTDTDTAAGRVVFRDRSSGATGRAAEVEYAFNRALVTLADPAGRVELESPGAGRLADAERVEIALEAGTVDVASGGALFDRDDDPAAGARRSLRWAERARFTFELEDGLISDRLRTARLLGSVRGVAGDASLAGSSLHARFEPLSGPGPGATPDAEDTARALSVVDVRRAEARQGSAGGGADAGSLTADALRVIFHPDADRAAPEPARVIAAGDVVATQPGGGTVRAQTLDADLDRGPGDALRLATAVAEGGVIFDDAAGATGAAPFLSADLVEQTARLAGPGARATRRGATIGGRLIRLAADPGTLEVDGPGNFAQGLEAERDLPPGLVTASWTRSMRYDDAEGRLNARGEVVAVNERFGLRRDRFTADRLSARLDAESDRPPQADADRGEPLGGPRRLRGAVLTGAAGAPATAETRRYFEKPGEGQGPPEPRLAELLFLESSDIIYAGGERRVTAPAPGRLVVVDRRSVREQIDAGVEPAELGPGQTLFTWQDRMTVAADAGEASFHGGVVVNHLDLRTRRPAVARAERIDATFDLTDDQGGNGPNEGGTLRTLTAEGDARLRNDRRELAASRVRYDAAAGRALATAARGTLVTYLDRSTGTVTRAKELLWDLLADRIDVLEPAPTVAPASPPPGDRQAPQE